MAISLPFSKTRSKCAAGRPPNRRVRTEPLPRPQLTKKGRIRPISPPPPNFDRTGAVQSAVFDPLGPAGPCNARRRARPAPSQPRSAAAQLPQTRGACDRAYAGRTGVGKTEQHTPVLPCAPSSFRSSRSMWTSRSALPAACASACFMSATPLPSDRASPWQSPDLSRCRRRRATAARLHRSRQRHPQKGPGSA